MSGASTFDAIAATLADAHERFGATAFTNRRRLIGLLADHVPDARREIRAVGTAIDEGVPVALDMAERHLIGMEMDRLAERLDATTGLRVDIARPIVRSFAYAIGRGPLPSIYVASVPAAPPVPASRPIQHLADDTHVTRPPAPPQTDELPRQAAHEVSFNAQEHHDVFVIGGRSVPKRRALLGGGGLLLVLASLQLLSGETMNLAPAPVTNGQAVPQAGQSGTPDPRPDYGIPVAEQNYADEATDFGVASQSVLESNVGTRTPMIVPGGRRISTAALQQMLATDSSVVLIDVLDNEHGKTVRGAKFMPELGHGGTVDDQTQTRAVAMLARATDERKLRPIVFLCQGAECWESYNAVLRASAAGYINLYWYRGGIAAWTAAGLPVDTTPFAN